MDIYEIPLKTIDGKDTTLAEHEGDAMLIVNVASKCGFTPQYEGLQRLYDGYRARGFTILGFPCNQFLAQEPGTHDDIRDFCSMTYGITFPLFAKCDVNGEARHPLFDRLAEIPDDDGADGDVRWNFEKFLIAPHGSGTRRFRTQITPEDPALVAAIEGALPA